MTKYGIMRMRLTMESGESKESKENGEKSKENDLVFGVLRNMGENWHILGI
jgi:hypothetical protein